MSGSSDSVTFFGDESGNLGADRFFAIGLIATRDVDQVLTILREIRTRANYTHEISYKSNDKRRALCAFKWMDWFFSGQQIAKYKIIIKDSESFSLDYYKNNAFKASAVDLAYCESYAETLRNFCNFNECDKKLVYSRKSLGKMEIKKYLSNKVRGLDEHDCHEGHCDEKTKDERYTGNAELLQLADLITGATRGLCCALYDCERTDDWVKNGLRRNIRYHMPVVSGRMKDWTNYYYPAREPYSEQIFNLFMWKPS